MKKFFSVAKFLIGWPLAIVALFFVVRIFLTQKESLSGLQSINTGFVLISLALFVTFFFLRSLFWQKLLQKKGIHFPFKLTALTWGLSEFKRYVPGSIWPIVGRSSAYEKLGTGKKETLKGILHEAQFLLISCSFLSLMSLNFLFFGIFHTPFGYVWIAGIAFIVCIATVIFITHQKFLPKKFFLQHMLPQLSFRDMLSLFLLSTFSFLLFGLANYFAVSAIKPLYLLHVLPLAGFFIFAFLVGYLSFLAPMGLGVREGILTIGLAKYIPVADAALGALAARLIQIIGELVFLLVCIVWEKAAGNTRVKKIESFLLKRKYEISMFFSVALYTIYFSLASILKYENYFAGRFDLGNMDQTVWNTIHGRIFQLTDPNGTAIVSRLAFHADFMLILISPFYYIWQDPRMLLLIQTVAIGIGGFFVYAIANHIIKKKPIALAFTLSYLLYPTLQYANLFDFHSVTIAVPLFLASWYLILKNKFIQAALFLLLAATVKEQVWLMLGLFGIYFFFWKKQYILGTLLTCGSIAVFYYLIQYAIPAAHGSGHFALTYYSDFGSSPGSILKSMLLSPVKTFFVIFGKGQLVYLLGLFAPVGFLPLASLPLLLFIAPDLGISLLSQNAQLHQLFYHYGAIPTPFFFLAGIYGFAFLAKRFRYLCDTYGVYLILVPALICAYIFGPLPGASRPSIAMFTDQLTYSSTVDAFLQSIPKRYSVAASNNIGSHLSHRKEIFTIPVGLNDADIVVFLLNDGFAQPSLAVQKQMAAQLDNDPSYVRLIADKDFVVYKKKNVPTYYKKQNTNILPLFKGD